MCFACTFTSFAQKDTLPYNKKREVIYDEKRYLKYNNYITFGIGKAYAKIRTTDQNVLNLDFHFHLNKEYFQAGFFMSGDELLANNNLEFHLGYGKRYEKNNINLAAFAGPSYSAFNIRTSDSTGVFKNKHYELVGGYLCLQAVYKIKYDVGLGIELFTSVCREQQLYGARFIIFFSGGYRGPEKAFHLKTSKP